MEILGIQLTGSDWQTFVQSFQEFALPRLAFTAGLLLVAIVVHRLGEWLVRRLERGFIARTKTEMDDAVVRAVRRAFVISVWFWVAWRVTVLWGLEATSRAAVAAWIVGLSLPLAGLVSDMLSIFEREVSGQTAVPLDRTALPLLNKIVRFLVVALAFLVALEFVGVDVTPLLAGAGVAGLAVSLAAKDTLSNLIAGILLILDRPFQVGDRIELWSAPTETGSWGDVIEIGLRATKIRNPDNLVVVIPNNEIMRRDIVNYSASGGHIRLRIPFGVSYDSDVKRAKELILKCAEEVEGVKLEPPPKVIVRSFEDSAVKLELRVWIQEARRRRAIGDEITERVKDAFDAGGVEIPYPKRDIYVRTESGGLEGPAPKGGGQGAEGAGEAPEGLEGPRD